MFFQTIIHQTAFRLKKRSSLCVFGLLICLVLVNFIRNVLAYQGRDVADMYQPMKLLLLSYNQINVNADLFLLLIQIYPLLVVIPAGFSMAKEYQSGQEIYMVARMGRRGYQYSGLAAVFLTTFLLFTVPFLLEILLNCLSFPLEASRDLSNLGRFDASYEAEVRQYLFRSLYLYSPYLYAIFMSVRFGLISGLLGVFTAACSLVVRVKYSVFLFLPVFLLLQGTVFFNHGPWYHYLSIFNGQIKEHRWFLAACALLVVVSVGMAVYSSRKDSI